MKQNRLTVILVLLLVLAGHSTATATDDDFFSYQGFDCSISFDYNYVPTVRIEYETYASRKQTTLDFPDSVEYNNRRYCVNIVDGVSGNGIENLVKVKLPKYATFIYFSAFKGCTNLVSVEMPVCVTRIGENCFQKCTSLSEITLPASLSVIDACAFQDCKSLKRVTIPSGVTKINDYTFCGCGRLETVELSENLRSIGKYAFSGCPITRLDLPGSLSHIANDAFACCSSLTTITVASGSTYDSRDGCNAVMESATNTLTVGCKGTVIPNGTDAIGDSAFFGYRTSETIVIPESVRKIGKGSFGHCTSLTSIKLPSTLQIIDEYAFDNDSNLTTIELPASLDTIKPYAFTYCKSLTSIEVPEHLKSLSGFDHCKRLNSVKFASNSTLTEIGNWAFYYCEALQSIELPASVSSVGTVSFEGTALKTIWLSENVDYLGSQAFCYCKNLETVHLPNKLRAILSSTFNTCSRLRTINFPDSLSEIGTAAFRNCASLDSVGFDHDVQIGPRAFKDCTGLIALRLPDNGYEGEYQYTFSGCTELKRIYNYRQIPLSIEREIFELLVRPNCTLYVPAESVTKYKAAKVWQDFIIKGVYNSGVSDVVTDRATATPVGYCDLAGRRLSGAQPGVNIVRYSDGTTRKVLVK